jgi:hypothetical protein
MCSCMNMCMYVYLLVSQMYIYTYTHTMYIHTYRRTYKMHDACIHTRTCAHNTRVESGEGPRDPAKDPQKYYIYIHICIYIYALTHMHACIDT